MKPATLLLLPILALALSSCVVEVPSPGTGSAGANSAATPNSASPSIRTLPSGDIQAVYPGQGRDVLFDRNGNLKAGGYGCNDEDLFRAKQAVRAYLGR
jgi:hypothetical protein